MFGFVEKLSYGSRDGLRPIYTSVLNLFHVVVLCGKKIYIFFHSVILKKFQKASNLMSDIVLQP